MKCFFLIFVAFSTSSYVFGVLTDEQKEKIQSYDNECIAETGVARDVVQKAQQGILIDDPKLKAFAYCVSKKVGLQKENGEVQLEVLKQRLPSLVEDAEKASDLIVSCVHDKETPEETAFHSFICYFKAYPKTAQV